MELERVAVVIRPRRSWEAIDLGFAMVRTWLASVQRAWLASVLPLAALALLLCGRRPLWALLALWWLKPLFDRVVLQVLSRAVFGSRPGTREVLAAVLRLGPRQLLSALTLDRLELARSYCLPVWQLEELRGRRLRARIAVLKRRDVADAGWLSGVCVGIELVFVGSVVALLELLVPGGAELDWSELWRGLTGGQVSWGLTLGVVLSYLLAISAVEPFYVGAGFALYLNRRSWLEGWDIELAFRRLARRLGSGSDGGQQARAGTRSGAVSTLVLLLALLLPTAVSGVESGAATVAEQGTPQQLIEQILERPEYQTRRTRKVWSLRGSEEAKLDEARPEREATSALSAALGGVVELALWAALVAGVVTLLVMALRGRFRSGGDRGSGAELPELLFGLDIRPESLPDDVAAAAWTLWREGRAAEAMGLLYRGALAALVHRDQITVSQSWTEGECLRRIEPLLGAARGACFERLTRAWQSTAYAHRPPPEQEARSLCSDWTRHFGGVVR